MRCGHWCGQQGIENKVVAGGQNPVSVYLLRSNHLAFNYTRPEVSWDFISSASNAVNISLSFFPTFCSLILSLLFHPQRVGTGENECFTAAICSIVMS